MSQTDDLLRNAETFAESFDKGELPMPPARKVAIVACMDARISPFALFGLEVGDAHVIRNAGGVITEDEIRSLAISQRKLGTEEIILVHHTDCGMLTFTDDEFRQQIQEETGIKPQWPAESFTDLEEDLKPVDAPDQDQPLHPQHRQRAGLRLRGGDRQAARGHCVTRAAGSPRRHRALRGGEHPGARCARGRARRSCASIGSG